MTAVKIEHLQKRYGEITAVADVSLAINAGEIFGLLGPNGAGKTTTLQCLCTLLRPDAGYLEVGGVSVLEQPRQVRQKLGYVAQEVAIDKVLTGRELLQLQAALYHLNPKDSKERITLVLDLLGLSDRADAKSGTYSGGLRKRLDLAMGLLHQPEVLVLDEPTVGLDVESRLAIWAFLREIRSQGVTVLLTSHYLEEVDALADRVAIIDSGRVIACDTPTSLKQQVGGDRLTLKLQEFTPRADAEQAQVILETLPYVDGVVINAAQGNALNVVIRSDIGQAATEVRDKLEQAGFSIFALTQARPSLDDVYLAATGRTLLDAELAAAEASPKKK